MIGKANRGRSGRAIQLLLAGAMLASAGIAQAQQGGMDIKPVPSTPIADGFTFAAVGDLIYLRPMLATVERQAPGLVKLLRDADVAFGNFETSVLDLKTTKASPGAESGGTWMLGAPAIVPDLAKMGFDIVGHANNHTVDWGEQGLLETLDHLEKGGLVFSGMSPDGQLPEIVERPDHPWFVGVQFHPELKSKPFDPHPLFASFIEAAVKQSRLV